MTADILYERHFYEGLTHAEVVAVSSITAAVVVTLLVLVKPAADAIAYAADVIAEIPRWFRERWRAWWERHGSTEIEDPGDDHEEWCERLPDHVGACNRRRYLVVPGDVTSRTDGDRHYVGFSRLIDLYGVKISDCIMWREHFGPHQWYAMREGLIILQPRSDGDYRIPSNVLTGRATNGGDMGR